MGGKCRAPKSSVRGKLTADGIDPCTTSSFSRTSIKNASCRFQHPGHVIRRAATLTEVGCSVFGFSCSYEISFASQSLCISSLRSRICRRVSGVLVDSSRTAYLIAGAVARSDRTAGRDAARRRATRNMVAARRMRGLNKTVREGCRAHHIFLEVAGSQAL